MEIGLHLITVLSILAFKMSALIIGYLVVKLGYELLVKGITGEFKFQGEIAGGKADLVSASPGLLFLLLGVLLMGTAVLKDNPFSTTSAGTPPALENSSGGLIKPPLDI